MFVPNLKILGQAVPEKSLTKNFNIHYMGVRDSKRKIKKKAKINLSTLVLFSVIHLVVLIVYTKI